LGWEARHGRQYFYKNARIGGRVVKRYFGCGDAAHLAEQFDVDARREAMAEITAIQTERNKLAPVEEQMADLDRSCRRMIEATLLASGFHQHCRSWRKNSGSRSCQ